MRHSDSSPPIPPRFVAFARRYHPSTCGSLRRTPGATSTASGLVSRCPRPGGLYDGDDEASRVPGKPTRTHATRSDPGEVAASTASETRRDDLPSNARRRPSHSMHFGAQLRGLRAPCERFAPWVTPGPRTRSFSRRWLLQIDCQLRPLGTASRVGYSEPDRTHEVDYLPAPGVPIQRQASEGEPDEARDHHHQAPYARRGARHPLSSGRRRHDRHRGQGFRTPKRGVYPGFPTLFLGLSGFFVNDLMGKALWKLVENAQRFPRCGGRVLCVHGAVSFHRAHLYATRSPRPRTAVDS